MDLFLRPAPDHRGGRAGPERTGALHPGPARGTQLVLQPDRTGATSTRTALAGTNRNPADSKPEPARRNCCTCCRRRPRPMPSKPVCRLQPTCRSATIRSAIPADTLLVEYFRVRDRILVCLLGPETLEILPVTLEARVAEFLRLLQFQLSKFRLNPQYLETFKDSLVQSTQAHLTELYRELIAPVASRLERQSSGFRATRTAALCSVPCSVRWHATPDRPLHCVLFPQRQHFCPGPGTELRIPRGRRCCSASPTRRRLPSWMRFRLWPAFSTRQKFLWERRPANTSCANAGPEAA